MTAKPTSAWVGWIRLTRPWNVLGHGPHGRGDSKVVWHFIKRHVALGARRVGRRSHAGQVQQATSSMTISMSEKTESTNRTGRLLAEL